MGILNFFEKRRIIKAGNTLGKYKEWYDEYIQEHPDVEEKCYSKIGKLDVREVPTYLCFKHGFNMKKADFFKFIDEDLEAYRNNPKKELDKFFDAFEAINYKDLHPSNQKKANERMLVIRCSQMNSKFLDDNPEYKKERYEKNLQTKLWFDILTGMNTSRTTADSNRLNYDIQYNTNSFKPFNAEDFEKYNNMKGLLSQSDALYLNDVQDYYENKSDHAVVGMPDGTFFEEYRKPRHGLRETPESQKYRDDFPGCILNCIETAVINPDGYNGKFVSQNKLDLDVIYINGESLNTILERKGVNMNHWSHRCDAAIAIRDAVMQGLPIDVAQPYEDKDKKVHTRIVPIEFKCSKEKEKELRDKFLKERYNPIRRLFNWGPWKIKVDTPFKQSIEYNRLSREENNAKIMQDINTRVIDKINANRKENEKVIAGNMLDRNTIMQLNNERELINNITNEELDHNLEINNNEINTNRININEINTDKVEEIEEINKDL